MNIEFYDSAGDKPRSSIIAVEFSVPTAILKIKSRLQAQFPGELFSVQRCDRNGYPEIRVWCGQHIKYGAVRSVARSYGYLHEAIPGHPPLPIRGMIHTGAGLPAYTIVRAFVEVRTA